MLEETKALEAEKDSLAEQIDDMIDYHNNLVEKIDNLETGEVKLAEDIIERQQEYNREYER